MHTMYCRYGNLLIEWDEYGSAVITRQDSGERMTLSLTEWSLLLKVMDLRGWPVCAPITHSATES